LGLHQNRAPEICLGLSGRPVLDIDRCRYSMAAPGLGIIAPGVWHSEGFSRRDQGYHMLWLMLSRESVLGSVIRYRPGHGWESIENHTVKAPAVRPLFECIGNPEHSPDSGQWNLIRGHLLAILGQLAWQATQSTTQALGEPAAWVRHRAVLDHLKEQLDHHLEQGPDLEQLAQRTRLTSRYLARLFKAWTGESVHRYHIQQRMMHALRLCQETNLLVKEVARRVGYGDPLYFSRAFHRYHGRWPNEVRGR
jgi:AraC-like DNA-binding protein